MQPFVNNLNKFHLSNLIKFLILIKLPGQVIFVKLLNDNIFVAIWYVCWTFFELYILL
jgi:hypothetical protein